MKRLFEERKHLREYQNECVEYLITKECEKGSKAGRCNGVPAFLPEVVTSCFSVLLFIKYALVTLLVLLVCICCLLAVYL